MFSAESLFRWPSSAAICVIDANEAAEGKEKRTDQRPCRRSLRIAGHGKEGTVRDTLLATTPGEFSGQIKQHDGIAAFFLSLMATTGKRT